MGPVRRQCGASVGPLASWEDKTPLHAAAVGGSVPVTKLLLERGTNPNTVSADGRTPMMHAAALGHEAVVELLLEVLRAFGLLLDGMMLALVSGLALFFHTQGCSKVILHPLSFLNPPLPGGSERTTRGPERHQCSSRSSFEWTHGDGRTPCQGWSGLACASSRKYTPPSNIVPFFIPGVLLVRPAGGSCLKVMCL